jgi:hypothetical protein
MRITTCFQMYQITMWWHAALFVVRLQLYRGLPIYLSKTVAFPFNQLTALFKPTMLRPLSKSTSFETSQLFEVFYFTKFNSPIFHIISPDNLTTEYSWH